MNTNEELMNAKPPYLQLIINEQQHPRLNVGDVSNNVFDFETNFITCKCDEYELYPKHLGDGGYDWCKKCNCPLSSDTHLFTRT